MDSLGDVCLHGRLSRRCTECKYEELLTKYEALGAEYEELSIECERLADLVRAQSVRAEDLYTLIAHGDDEHRRWLKEKSYEFFGVALPAGN